MERLVASRVSIVPPEWAVPIRRTYIDMSIVLLLPHPFPLLCGVDVSYETPPFNPVLRFLPRQFSLRQVVLEVIQPPPLWSSSLSFPGYFIAISLLPTYSYLFLFSSQYIAHTYHFNLFSCTLFDISPNFVVPLILSFLILSSLVTPLIHLNNPISAIGYVYE